MRMFYLVHYNRKSRSVVRLVEYRDGTSASKDKLAVEIGLAGQHNGDEIVVLEANDMSDLKQSHGRYFGDLSKYRLFDKSAG